MLFITALDKLYPPQVGYERRFIAGINELQLFVKTGQRARTPAHMEFALLRVGNVLLWSENSKPVTKYLLFCCKKKYIYIFNKFCLISGILDIDRTSVSSKLGSVT